MTAPQKDWVIGSEGVGAVAIGKPLPESLLPKDLEARYFARYVGDAQPFEGFRFDAPQLTAILDGGPFSRKAEQEGGVEPNADLFRAAAAKAVREGAKVRVLQVRGPGPVTAAGVGVGTRLEGLKAAYADLSVHPVPATLGGDECVATSAKLPGVRFLFASCDAANSGAALIRIDVWP